MNKLDDVEIKNKADSRKKIVNYLNKLEEVRKQKKKFKNNFEFDFFKAENAKNLEQKSKLQKEIKEELEKF